MRPEAEVVAPLQTDGLDGVPLGQLREYLRSQLLPVAQEGAALEAGLLLMAVLDCSRAQLLTRDDRPLSADQLTQLTSFAQRRIGGEPMAYILGQREFWSLPLRVTEATLIPRPETELLVELALEALGQAPAKVADLGTGSGAIALALASERPQWQLVATDISAAALKVATGNALQLSIDNVEFRLGQAGFDQADQWLAPLANDTFDLIVSNPPYVAEIDACLHEGDTSFEPRGALAAGVDGLDDLKILIARAADHLLPGGRLLLEHGYDQQQAVMGLLTDAGWQQINCFKDIAGQDRAVMASLT